MELRLDIFTDLLPHAGIAELEEGDGADDKEDDDRDGCGKTVVHAAAAGEGQVIHIADQDVGMPGRSGCSGHGRATCVEQIDQIEVVEVEGERGDQQRSDGDQQQGQGDIPELLPGVGAIHLGGIVDNPAGWIAARRCRSA